MGPVASRGRKGRASAMRVALISTGARFALRVLVHCAASCLDSTRRPSTRAAVSAPLRMQLLPLAASHGTKYEAKTCKLLVWE